MSAGHRHGAERAASKLADDYYEKAKPLVEACTVDRSYQCPSTANRTRDCKTVFVDESVPVVLKCGVNTDLSLPWHEIPECLGMDDGLPYDTGEPNAHGDIATPLERREVERQKPDDPDIWRQYSDEMDGYIREVDDETVTHVPPDMDMRVFTEAERQRLEELIASGDDGEASGSRSRITRMPKLLKPSDVAQRFRAGETAQSIFVDDNGQRAAKVVGLTADISPAAEDRAVEFVISTGALDRYNSTIAPDGWRLDNFNRNPVVLWMHDDYTPAIARAENTRIEDKLRSRAVFATRDQHPLADTIYQLIKAKIINAASVGWIPIEWKWIDDDGRGFGIDYLEQELLEWSVVNIPANPECLVGARSMGIDTKPLIGWCERALDRNGLLMVPRTELEQLRRAAGAPSVAKPIRTADTLKESAGALKTLLKNRRLTVDQFADQVIELAVDHVRAGRVLSAENEATLRKAHQHARDALDHCQAACDHVMSVVDQCTDHAEDGDGDDGNGTTEDPEQASASATTDPATAPQVAPTPDAAETAARAERLARLNKLKGGTAATAAV